MKQIFALTIFFIFGSFALAKRPANTEAYKHCEPNEEKLKDIMDSREKCNVSDSSTENTQNLYKALANLVACDDYNIDRIGVVELYKTRGIVREAPCTVKIKGVSAEIGGGEIELFTDQGVKKIRWDGNHDLTSKRNDVKYWQDQLEPQVIDLIIKKLDSTEIRPPKED